METGYYIAESCMQPNGAWAKTKSVGADEAKARKAFASFPWTGPESGRMWGRTISLHRREVDGANVTRTMIAERNLD